MNDILEIIGMEFYSGIGCYKEEQIIGNRFLIDLQLKTDCSLPAISDNIKDALNYQLVYDLVKIEMQTNCCLIENAAKRILDKLFLNFNQLNEVTIKLSKLNPPLGGKLEKVSIIFNKKR